MRKTKQEIIDYINNKGMVSPHELAKAINIGASMTHRYLKDLTEQKVLLKHGMPPKVYYSVSPTAKYDKKMPTEFNIDTDTQKLIEENFILLTPDGTEVPGFQGFIDWCTARNLNISTKAQEYEKLFNKYFEFKKDGVIDATSKISNTFSSQNRFLDSMYYLHPYSLPIFGKLKIAHWLFHGKQTQNKRLIKKVLDIVVPEIENFIQKEGVGAIAFVSPTVPRAIQFMKELQKAIHSNLPHIMIEKIKTPILVQQKSLKDVQERVQNAESTLIVKGSGGKYKKVLIIDDFTGSGSTLNVLAKKCKAQNIADQVVGLTITGSMNGFEVIKEI